MTVIPTEEGELKLPFVTYSDGSYKKIQHGKGDVCTVGIEKSTFSFVYDMKL